MKDTLHGPPEPEERSPHGCREDQEVPEEAMIKDTPLGSPRSPNQIPEVTLNMINGVLAPDNEHFERPKDLSLSLMRK